MVQLQASKLHEYTFKIALVGSQGTGKTSIIRQYTDHAFISDYKATLGCNIIKKTLNWQDSKGNENRVNITIWDIAGQKKYDRMRRMYFQGSAATILVYDVTRPSSFEEIRDKWLADYSEFGEKNSIFFLVGNKIDLKEKVKVGTSRGYQLAQEINAQDFIETSARTGENIERLFEQMVHRVIQLDVES